MSLHQLLRPTSLSVHMRISDDPSARLFRLTRQRDEAEALLDDANPGLRAWASNEAMRLSREIRALRMKGFEG
jgi:hypothetical protein